MSNCFSEQYPLCSRAEGPADAVARKGRLVRLTGIKSYLTGDRARLAKNVGWLLGERVVTLLAHLFLGIAVARYLGPSEFGVYSLALALITFVLTVSSLGLNHTLTREFLVNPQSVSEVLTTAITLRLIGALTCCTVAAMLAFLYFTEFAVLGPMVLVLSAGALIRSLDALEFYFHAALRGQVLAVTRGLAAVFAVILALIAIGQDADSTAFAYVRSVEYAVAAAGLMFVYLRECGSASFAKPTFTRAQSLLTKSWPLLLSSLGAVIYMKIDQAMLAAMAGPAAVGIYSVAAQLSEVWYFLPVAVANSVFPALMSARSGNQAEYERRLQKLYDLFSMLGWGAALVVSFGASSIIKVLYGDAYTASAAVLSLHIWAGIFVFMRAAYSKWLIAEELYSFSLVSHGTGAILNVVLNFALIPRYGAIGAAAATVISYAAASYGSLFLHSKTRPAALMMTRALVAPARYVFR